MDSDPKTSTALVRKRDDLDLMPPPPPPKRIKRPKVIDEDSYTDALSQIIARDFFPGLLESETQQEYLDALESKDPEWISSASRRLQHVMTPGRRRSRRGAAYLAPGSSSTTATPRTTAAGTPTPGRSQTQTQTPRSFAGDTPVSVSSSSAGTTTTTKTSQQQQQQPEIDINMSLSAFQSKYTSEDNESFYRLLDRQNSKRAEKYAWLWSGNNKLPSKMHIAQRKVEQRLVESGASLEDDGFGKRDRLAIRDRRDADRPAQPDTWKFAPQNGLMFTPDGVEDSVPETRVQAAEAASRAPPRAVSYQNTRMPSAQITTTTSTTSEDDDVTTTIPPSPSLSAIRDAIAGRRRPGGDSDSVATSSSVAAGNETPRINGYAFVPEDDHPPLPNNTNTNTKEIIKIDLGPGDATPNPFVIKEQSRREALHHRMVDRLSTSRRREPPPSLFKTTTKTTTTTTTTPRFPSSPRVMAGNLTPAARRLWSNIGSSSVNSSPRRPGSSTPRTPFDNDNKNNNNKFSSPVRDMVKGTKLKSQVSK
ncbi:nuclear protein DGCR14 [Xylariaceae sp. FL0594]|nr:nuclear protein DGCR14 [Xylariaceae sp. FL0594]